MFNSWSNLIQYNFFLALLFTISACGSTQQTQKETIVVDMSDAVVQRIYDSKNKRETKAILPYLSVDNPLHRYVATMALASMQDTTAIGDLTKVLSDDYEQIRMAAAFALGQTQNQAAAQPLVNAFRTDTVRSVQATILEAIGRCGTDEHLKYLSTVPPYPMEDTLLLEGEALGLYRFLLRRNRNNKAPHEESVRKIMIDFVANPLTAPSVKLISAGYLGRVNFNLSTYENLLIRNVEEEENPFVKMFLVLGLAKTKSANALETLLETYKSDEDYRVRCNVVRGLSYFNYDSVRTTALGALNDTSVAVRIVAADYFINNGQEKDAVMYSNLGDKHPNWQVATKLHEAAIRSLAAYKTPSKQFISQKLKTRYQRATSDYEKAAILKSMAAFSWNYKFIANEVFPKIDTIQVSPVIRSSGAEAIVSIRHNPNLQKEFGFGYKRVSDELNLLMRNMIESGDVAMQAIIAGAFAEQPELYKTAFPDYQFIAIAQQQLSLPRDIETHHALSYAISALSGVQQQLVPADKTSHVEIDWQLIDIIGLNPIMDIETSKGKIALRLEVESAPGTVTQFVQLAKAGFYDGKVFHRVVPNFVAQAGCSRGDGWGGFEYVAPSEFSRLRYDDEGWVGMASAGKDTEGTQFFITHSPTPHLDGNYTIFAKVQEGMETVHLLEVGDEIISIKLR